MYSPHVSQLLLLWHTAHKPLEANESGLILNPSRMAPPLSGPSSTTWVTDLRNCDWIKWRESKRYTFHLRKRTGPRDAYPDIQSHSHWSTTSHSKSNTESPGRRNRMAMVEFVPPPPPPPVNRTSINPPNKHAQGWWPRH